MKEFFIAFILVWILALASTYPVGANDFGWEPSIHPTSPCLSPTVECSKVYRIDPTLPGLSVRDRTAPSIIIYDYDDGREMGYSQCRGSTSGTTASRVTSSRG